MIDFNRFSENFKIDLPLISGQRALISEEFTLVNGVTDFLDQYAGQSFNNGLYRVFSGGEFQKWDYLVLGMFAQYEGKISSFGYDWMGRIFAWDHSEGRIVLLDPGFGEAFHIPCSFIELHNNEFVEYPIESLAVDLFKLYSSTFTPPSIGECVGYTISPFLGGSDEVNNMELFNLEVYWSICSDIYNQVS